MTYTSFYSASQKYVTSNLSDNAFRIYHYLLSMCYGKKNTCFPSQATIAKATHRTIRTIQRGLKELIQAGFILSQRRGSTSNLYTVLKKVQLQAKEVVSSATEKVEDTIKKVKNSFYSNKKKDNFNNFKQRQYNWGNLEDMLLGREDYDLNKL